MRVNHGGFLLFTGRKGSEVSGLIISGLDRMEESRQGVTSWLLAAMVGGKKCGPIPNLS